MVKDFDKKLKEYWDKFEDALIDYFTELKNNPSLPQDEEGEEPKLQETLNALTNLETDMQNNINDLKKTDKRLDSIINSSDHESSQIEEKINDISQEIKNKNDQLNTANQRSVERPDYSSYVIVPNLLTGGRPIILTDKPISNNLQIIIGFFFLILGF